MSNYMNTPFAPTDKMYPWAQAQEPNGKEAPPLFEARLSAGGYNELAKVLARAFEQASGGKGKERHASEGVPFEDQPMNSINREAGSIDGYLYQARKKSLESKRLPAGRAQAELLGAINYLAGAVIALDTWAAGTLPAEKG